MVSEAYIFRQFDKLSEEEQVQILRKALAHMKADSRRSEADCIALAMDIPIFPKIAEILKVDGYQITIRFRHGEVRKVDFAQLLDPRKKWEQQLLEDYEKFSNVIVQEGTLIWPSVGQASVDAAGEKRFFAFDVDPGLVYASSDPLVK